MSGQRPAANRSTLLQFKARILGAKKGHGLLKKKRDALKTRFQAMLKEIIICKKAVGAMVKDCAFSFAKAEYAFDKNTLIQSVLNRAKRPSMTLALKAENCAGVQLPTFKLNHDAALDDPISGSLGIGCGGSSVQQARDSHQKGLILFIKMASMQSMFKTLDEEIKMTSRRVNALECVVIPKLQDTMQWIKQEMDEMEREEFFRVKKVVEKKKARDLREKAAMKAREAEMASARSTSNTKALSPRTLGGQQIGLNMPGLQNNNGVMF